ncbi:MAG TPA: sugar phosphate isomerase/epimerase, partial [Ktedonobacteraceae bacterium]
MIYLSAFADEISPDLETQIEILRSENIHCIDFRSAWNINVLDLTDEQVMQAKELLNDKGIQVAALGSPIGKVPIDTPFEEYMQRFERALTVAEMFGTHYIRIFSFYPSSNQPDTVASHEKVLHFLHEMTERAGAAHI